MPSGTLPYVGLVSSSHNSPLDCCALSGFDPRRSTNKKGHPLWMTLFNLVEHRGIEPLTSWLPAMRSPS